MSSDKNEIYELLTALERISNKIDIEVNKLKKKLKIPDIKPKIRACSYELFENVLKPIFMEKEIVSLQEIIKKSGKKKTTLLCYLSELFNYGFIYKIRNLRGDKRTKLYKEVRLINRPKFERNELN